MADADVSLHILDHIAYEDLVCKSHALFGVHVTEGSFGV